MTEISPGAASEENKATMFDLVFKHQRQRIMCYLKWLKRAFRPENLTARRPSKRQAARLESRVESQPLLKSRLWTDDNGFEFEIPINLPAQVDDLSEAVLTGESVKDLDVSISHLFSNIHRLCSSDLSQETGDILLKELIQSAFDLWKGLRTQSPIKAHLHRHFGENRKQKREAENALLCSCNIYYYVYTFIKAAEKLKIFKSIDYIPVRYQAPGSGSDATRRQRSPLEVANILGITVHRPGWIDYLNREGPKFATLVRQKRCKGHYHAEIQTLHHYDFLLSAEERSMPTRTLDVAGGVAYSATSSFLHTGVSAFEKRTKR